MKIRKAGMAHPMNRPQQDTEPKPLSWVEVNVTASLVNNVWAGRTAVDVVRIAKQLMKPAWQVLRQSGWGVTVNLAYKWPCAIAQENRMVMNPLDTRSSIRHGVGHEMGHIAHKRDKFENVLRLTHWKTFKAWRLEQRQAQRLSAHFPKHRYALYLVSGMERRKIISKPPSLWRISLRESVLELHKRLRGTEDAENGWDEFLAEAFEQTYNTRTFIDSQTKKRMAAMHSYFPRSLQAYKKAIAKHSMNDRRKKAAIALQHSK